MSSGLGIVVDASCPCICELPSLAYGERQGYILHQGITTEMRRERRIGQRLASIQSASCVQPLHRNHFGKFVPVFGQEIDGGAENASRVRWFRSTGPEAKNELADHA